MAESAFWVVVGLLVWFAGVVLGIGYLVFAELREQALKRVGRPLDFNDERAPHNWPITVCFLLVAWPAIPVFLLAWGLLVGARWLLERHYARKGANT